MYTFVYRIFIKFIFFFRGQALFFWMPSRAWVVTLDGGFRKKLARRFNALTGLSCYVQLGRQNGKSFLCQCPHGLELLLDTNRDTVENVKCQCPHGLELLPDGAGMMLPHMGVSMPSRAWVVTKNYVEKHNTIDVSMPSRAWVVTARMSNILNFLWYFLCIPAIYKCILAYLPIFFNQLSKFLRCESPSTFLGTYLSHHSFIIFLVTNTNALLSGLYLTSTWLCWIL